MKNLLITIDFGNIPSFAITAKSRQLSDWFKQNKNELGIDNVIIVPDAGSTKLYWLDGEIDNIDHRTKLDDLAKRLSPILCAAIDMKYDKEDVEYKKAIDQLKELRELQERRAQAAQLKDKRRKLILPPSFPPRPPPKKG